MAKAVIFGIICVLLIGVFYGINYTTKIDEAQRNLDEAKRELGDIDKAIAYQQKITELRKELAALLQASEILSKQNDGIRAEIRSMEQSETRLTEAFLRSVERVRAETVGLMIEELPLANGTLLKRVRVQSIDRTEMSVLHSEGITKIPLDNLPEDLKERLRIGIMTFGGSVVSNNYRPDSSASDRMAELGRSGLGKKDDSDKPAAGNNTGNSKVEGDPALWNSVTRQSLGKAFIPGQGWLQVGPKGPIPGSGKK